MATWKPTGIRGRTSSSFAVKPRSRSRSGSNTPTGRWGSEKAFLDSLARQARARPKTCRWSRRPASSGRSPPAVCATDLKSHESRMDRTRQYRETFVRFLKAKNIFSSFRWVTPAPPESFYPSEDALIEKGRAANSKRPRPLYMGRTARRINGPPSETRKVKIQGDGPQDFPYLNISTCPGSRISAGGFSPGAGGLGAGRGLLLVEIVLLFYTSAMSLSSDRCEVSRAENHPQKENPPQSVQPRFLISLVLLHGACSSPVPRSRFVRGAP